MPYARLISRVYLALFLTEQRTIVNEKHGSCLRVLRLTMKGKSRGAQKENTYTASPRDSTGTITYVAHYFARFREFSTFLTTPCSA